MSAMTRGERTELRSVIRQQFKVLRSEIAERRGELVREMERELVERYSQDDEKKRALQSEVATAVDDANRAIEQLLDQYGFTIEGGYAHMYRVSPPRLMFAHGEREQLHRAAVAEVDGQVKTALLKLDRQEADLTRQLALDAIESEAARAFLASIPAVGELVPGARLAELEASLREDDPR